MHPIWPKHKEISTDVALLAQDMDCNPEQEELEYKKLFCFAIIADCNDNTLYMDLTGWFPIQSFSGNQYIFCAYNYTTNAILMEPIKNITNKEWIGAYKKVYKNLQDKNFRPRFNVMVN